MLNQEIKFTNLTISKRVLLEILNNINLLLKNGVNLREAVAYLIEKNSRTKLNSVLQNINYHLNSGLSPSDSFAKAINKLPIELKIILNIGHQINTLPDLLETYIAYENSRLNFLNKIQSSLIYPIILLVITIISLTILIFFLLPEFEQLFISSNLELPKVTQILLLINEWLQNNFIILTIVMINSIIGLFLLFKLKRFKILLDDLLLRMPLIGNVIKQYNFYKFCYISAILVKAELNFIVTLEHISYIFNNKIFKRKITELINQLLIGKSLRESISKDNFYPQIIQNLLVTGEATNNLSNILNNLATIYQTKINNFETKMTNLIEPVTILLVSSLVGFVVIAIYLPIFQLGLVVK